MYLFNYPTPSLSKQNKVQIPTPINKTKISSGFKQV
uniref:Uncharacterized protein n=1 Tax=Rhizophora mucronata TaxID=61149 RepID=A0A2P2QG24_RHIMU